MAMFVTFLLLGRLLEMRARHRAEQSLEQSTSQLPATAIRIAGDGGSSVVPLEALVPGELDTKGAFLAHNRALIADVAKLESLRAAFIPFYTAGTDGRGHADPRLH